MQASSQVMVRRRHVFAHRHLSGLTEKREQGGEVMLSRGHSDNIIRFSVMAHRELAVIRGSRENCRERERLVVWAGGGNQTLFIRDGLQKPSAPETTKKNPWCLLRTRSFAPK